MSEISNFHRLQHYFVTNQGRGGISLVNVSRPWCLLRDDELLARSRHSHSPATSPRTTRTCGPLAKLAWREAACANLQTHTFESIAVRKCRNFVDIARLLRRKVIESIVL